MRTSLALLLTACCAACSGGAGANASPGRDRHPVTELDDAGMKTLVEQTHGESVARFSYGGMFYPAARAEGAMTSAQRIECGTKQGWWTTRPYGPSGYLVDMTERGRATFNTSAITVDAGDWPRLSTAMRATYQVDAPFTQLRPAEKAVTYDAETVRTQGMIVDTISPFFVTSATFTVDSPDLAELKLCGIQVETTVAKVGELSVQFARKCVSKEWVVYELAQANVTKSTSWQ